MKFQMDNGLLTVVCDRAHLTSDNTAAFEQDMNEILQKNPHTSVRMDIRSLEYTSSAGLRIFLKIRKKEANFELFNASLEVCDIFETTGFNEIIPIRKALREISVDGCELIGKGWSGSVYRIDEDTIVKLYFGKPLSEIEEEQKLAKFAFRNGVPTAIPFDIVTCGENYGLVFELFKANTLSKHLMNEPEHFDFYADKFARLFMNLHEIEPFDSGLSFANDIYHGYADGMKQWLSDNEVAQIHRVIDSIPRRNILLHHDFHPKNIMVQDGELLLIDMGDMCYGHPLFDFAASYRSHILIGEFDGHNIENIVGISAECAHKLYNHLIHAVFEGTAEQNIRQYTEVIRHFSMLHFAILLSTYHNPPQNLIVDCLNTARKDVLPNAESMIAEIRQFPL